MGLNMVVVCEDGKGFDYDGDLHFIGTYMEELDKIATKMKLRPLAPYVVDPEAMGDDDAVPGGFLDPKDAIATLAGLAALLKETPRVARSIDEVDGVIEEVPKYIKLLERAVKRKKRVCFMFV